MEWKYKIELRYENGDIGHFSVFNEKSRSAIEEAKDRAEKEVDYVKDVTYVSL